MLYVGLLVQNRGEGMLFISKVGCAGVVFLLLATWVSGPRPTPPDSGANVSSEAPPEADGNDIKKMQQTLQDRGQYRGKIDGVPGLRTRASIRGFQKAESLPVTGNVDVKTASKLGVRPEVREETSHETPQDKPSAGIKWAHGSRRAGKTVRKPAEKVVTAEREER
jgi:peptidoglycan hydrolase-like protein with peptidoglycan-binding domain